MTIKNLKPSLLTLFVSFSCLITIAQPPKTLQTIPKNLKKLKGRLPWPINNIAELFTYEQAKRNRRSYRSSDLMPFLTIRADSPAIVKNPVTGIVSRAFDIEGLYSVMIRHNDYCFVYNNLDTIFINKGDTVLTRQPIVKIATRTPRNLYELDVLLFHKSKKIDPRSWFIPIDKPTSIY